MGDTEQPTIDLDFERADINIALLHEQLKAVLGDQCTGVSTGNGHVRVHVLVGTPPEVFNLVGPIIDGHDPNMLTAAQQQELDREMLLQSLQKPWDTWTALDKDRFLGLLAEQVGIGGSSG